MAILTSVYPATKVQQNTLCKVLILHFEKMQTAHALYRVISRQDLIQFPFPDLFHFLQDSMNRPKPR